MSQLSQSLVQTNHIASNRIAITSRFDFYRIHEICTRTVRGLFHKEKQELIALVHLCYWYDIRFLPNGRFLASSNLQEYSFPFRRISHHARAKTDRCPLHNRHNRPNAFIHIYMLQPLSHMQSCTWYSAHVAVAHTHKCISRDHTIGNDCPTNWRSSNKLLIIINWCRYG